VDPVLWFFVVDPDVPEKVLHPPFSLYWYGQRLYSVGAQNSAPVPKGLLHIAVELFQNNLLLPDQAGIIVDRTVIKQRIDQVEPVLPACPDDSEHPVPPDPPIFLVNAEPDEPGFTDHVILRDETPIP
jgi:hypothetical protein